MQTVPPEGVKPDTMPLILAFLAANEAKAVLDIGCGHGRLSAALSAEGFAVTGIEPQQAAVAAARAAVPSARFEVAGAEALPFADASFDAAIFLNSLHHVPVKLMRPALCEAIRVLRPGQPLIVVEPVAEGTFFEVMRPVEDETAIRAAAADAITAAQADGAVRITARIAYDRVTWFAGVQGFIDGLIAVDPARAGTATAERAAIERLFTANVRPDGDGFALEQPMVLYRLTAA